MILKLGISGLWLMSYFPQYTVLPLQLQFSLIHRRLLTFITCRKILVKAVFVHHYVSRWQLSCWLEFLLPHHHWTGGICPMTMMTQAIHTEFVQLCWKLARVALLVTDTPVLTQPVLKIYIFPTRRPTPLYLNKSCHIKIIKMLFRR